MSAEIINGHELAAEVRSEVASTVREMKSKHSITPGLAVLLVGDDPASAVYVSSKDKAAIEAGMLSKGIVLPAATSQEEILGIIRTLNEDPAYHGILVQLPLPAHIDENTIIESVNPEKDVDGLHPYNMGLLMAGRPRFAPATPAGIQEMLVRSGNSPEGKHVVVCGRSNIVGKPIANMLMQRGPAANATVTVCHTRTRDLASITRQADILIAAVGQARMITADMVKSGAVVIDVGVNRVADESRKRGYRLVGDVDFEPVARKAKAITPVPGGVGPMTIAMLLRNTVDAARRIIHAESPH
ncbi:MAG: bifunctional methylenetetrahydrofolate dehydrogenase/methenyltetrahydrofolate cyclohydrolase FolD [Chloroflexi bacterium]|nr:bifunctional methylenetetrahydrofolate dehydrogenase/methenyltetrahydrofolate cyclohydrolase FolD [Chloroflexota bacterium]MDA1228588.1 bifunctional methylenetetrahydrofolate dehydrogenase/methenyltetrahydrofolate cyclohydrolase FolD [Chloroflexota bacterium]